MIRTMLFVMLFLFFAGLCGCGPDNRNAYRVLEVGIDWPVYGGGPYGNRYSPLDQINIDNVAALDVAWIFDTGENSPEDGKGHEIQCQPIVVDGTVYATTPQLKAVAFDGGTGQLRWKFDPFADMEPVYHANRGVTYWQSGTDRRILYTAGAYLFALDAETGTPIPSFGDGGRISLYTGLETTVDHDVRELMVIATSPGAVFEDLIIMGSRVSEFGDAAPGHVRAFNVYTGALEWIFHTIPQPGEYGYDTWPADAHKYMGGANNWAGMVIDHRRGAVYLGTGSPSSDFYGGARAGKNLFGNCILSLDARTGKRNWHFQTIHHDLWDRDISSPPNLITVEQRGKRIDAVAQVTKDGVVFVLDRDTGEPLFPVTETPVPTDGALSGEQPWPTQPVPERPAPFSRQVYTEADLNDWTPETHAFLKSRYEQTRSGHKYTPLTEAGTLLFHIGGGAEWGGAAADNQGVLYINANNIPWDIRMIPVAQPGNNSTGEMLYLSNCSACHGKSLEGGGANYPSLINVTKKLSSESVAATIDNGKGMMPSFKHLPVSDRKAILQYLGAAPSDDLHAENRTDDLAATAGGPFPYRPPYVNDGLVQFQDPQGYPGVKPPWGTLSAINLHTGDYLWQVPLGEYPELTAKGIPVTGTENHGGPIVTAGGLLFIGATKDERIRAFNIKNGEVVWEYQLPAGAFATPASYEVNGVQYILVAAGGRKHGLKAGGTYIAFALPQSDQTQQNRQP